mmetsp:Transcript_33356/g.116927  ORF Transcript_33356/g.116927 Transcript_33356/m.116927 type:complete len:201 (+) Transcript_33356:1332-1934(+)
MNGVVFGSASAVRVSVHFLVKFFQRNSQRQHGGVRLLLLRAREREQLRLHLELLVRRIRLRRPVQLWRRRPRGLRSHRRVLVGRPRGLPGQERQRVVLCVVRCCGGAPSGRLRRGLRSVRVHRPRADGDGQRAAAGRDGGDARGDRKGGVVGRRGWRRWQDWRRRRERQGNGRDDGVDLHFDPGAVGVGEALDRTICRAD